MTDTDRQEPSRPAELTDDFLGQFIGYEMKRIYVMVREDLERTLAPLGLRMRTFSALGIIIENPDITQTQLSQSLGVERSGVVVLVDELESNDLISRGRIDGDRRSYALRTTLAGRSLWKKAEARVQAHEARVFGALEPSERSALLAALKRVRTG